MKRILCALAISMGLLVVTASPASAASESGNKSCGSSPAPSVHVISYTTYNTAHYIGSAANMYFYKNWGTNTWRRYQSDSNWNFGWWQVYTSGRLDAAKTYAACGP